MRPELSRDGKWVLESRLGHWDPSWHTDTEALFIVRQLSKARGKLVRIRLPWRWHKVISSPNWIGGTDSWSFLVYDLENYVAHLYIGHATPNTGRRSPKVAHATWDANGSDEIPYLSDRLKVLGQTERNALLVVARIRRDHVLLAERSPRGGAGWLRSWKIDRPAGWELYDICWSEQSQRVALLLESYGQGNMEILTMPLDGTDARVVGSQALGKGKDFERIRDLRYLPGGTKLSFEYKDYLWIVPDAATSSQTRSGAGRAAPTRPTSTIP